MAAKKKKKTTKKKEVEPETQPEPEVQPMKAQDPPQIPWQPGDGKPPTTPPPGIPPKKGKKNINLAVIQAEVQKRAGSLHPIYLTNALNEVLKEMGITMEEYMEARKKR